MRITQQEWFDFIGKVIEMNNYNNPLKLSLPLRLKLFKNAFRSTLKKNYPHYTPISSKHTFRCPNCHTSKPEKVISVNHFSHPFRIGICSNCHLGTQFPIPSLNEINEIYQNQNYFSGNDTKTGYFDYAKESTWRIKKARNYLNRVLSITKLHPQNIKVLDVGCGYGYFLMALKDKSIKADGLELSLTACNYAKSNYGLNVFPFDLNTSIKNGVIKENSYDLITLWDVIEHFPDFNSQINIISKLLKPEGYIALRTNNIDSIEVKTFNLYFHSIKNEHLFYFSPNSLDSIFTSHGYKKIKSWTHTHIFLAFMSIKERNQIGKNNLGGDIFYICQKAPQL